MKPLLRTLGLLCLATCSTSAADQPPNIVLIFADDLGYGDLGCYGATKVQTPNIDKLAAEGRRFTDAHSVSAVCTPSRYALLTGQYPVRANGGNGLWGPAPVTSPLLVDTGTTTIADVFKQSGYATACLGKWHLGFGDGTNNWKEPLRPGPQDLGFDYYFGMPVVNSAPPYVFVENDRVVGSDPTDPLVHLGRRAKGTTPITPIPPEAAQRSPNQFGGAKEAHKLFNDYQVGTTLAKKSVEWIENRKDKPFFLYLATTNIHHPFTPAKRFQGTSQCGLYGDFIHELDWIVGEIVSCLEENGLSDNTLVIFTSDNGGMFNIGGQAAFKAGHRQNGDLLGFKFGAWEGGHRVPMIVRWPGRVPAGSTSNQLMGHVDMLATIAALTDHELDKSQQADSQNMLPAFLGKPETPIRDHLVLAPHKGTHLSIRKGKWMYIPRQGSGGFGGKKPGVHTFAGPPAVSFVGSVNSDIENGKIKKGAPPAQLYDLEADVSQTRNVYNEHTDVVNELSTLLASYYSPPKQRAGSQVNNGRKPKNDGAKVTPPSRKSSVTSLKATYSQAKGIDAEKGVMRRDPSDIIKVGDRYYVWYSKGKIAPGYDATVWYATSRDGHEWTEQGMAVPKGKPGGWDGASVFTPNILVAEGRYWLFYTGTSKEYKKPFSPDSKIGIAVSDSPDGPWERLGTNPAVKNSDNPRDFDSHLIDDACLIVREGKYWLYFKGRQLGKGPGQTQMGLALADKPEGPYVKFENNPVISGNHEVLVWPQGSGVAAMIGTTGPKEITRSILYSEDGRRFAKTHDVNSVPSAGAGYRPEAFTDSGKGKQIQWGVHIGRRKGFLPFIERFDLKRVDE